MHCLLGLVFLTFLSRSTAGPGGFGFSGRSGVSTGSESQEVLAYHPAPRTQMVDFAILRHLGLAAEFVSPKKCTLLVL